MFSDHLTDKLIGSGFRSKWRERSDLTHDVNPVGSLSAFDCNARVYLLTIIHIIELWSRTRAHYPVFIVRVAQYRSDVYSNDQTEDVITPLRVSLHSNLCFSYEAAKWIDGQVR